MSELIFSILKMAGSRHGCLFQLFPSFTGDFKAATAHILKATSLVTHRDLSAVALLC